MSEILKGNLQAYVLLKDVEERCAVLRRDVKHLLNVSKFVRNYFYIEKEGGRVFQNYSYILKLMHKDICRILKCIEKVGDVIKEVTRGNSKNPFESFNDPSVTSNLIWDSLKLYCTENTIDEANDDELFKEFQRTQIFKKAKSFNIEDFLTLILIIRNALERSPTRSYELSLSVLNLALRGIRYSLDQAMRGCFAGHIIEQEPTTYAHRDLYHVIRYLTMYCDWYCWSMMNFTKHLFKDRKLIQFFYRITDVNVNVEFERSPYIIVFGDRTTPTLIERYNLISLPIVCAYRPRYWSAVAHEVAHTFVNGLLYVKWAFDDFQEYKYTVKIKENYLKILNLKKFNDLMDILKDIHMTARKLEKWGIFGPVKNHERWYEIVMATEILADIFAFLLSGYTYIQTASDLLAIGRVFPSVLDKVPFLVRLYAIYEFAENMLKENQKKKKRFSIKWAVDYVENYAKENTCNGCSQLKSALNDVILKEIYEGNWYESEEGFVKWYKDCYIEYYDLVKNVDISIHVRKLSRLGCNIGKRVYDAFEDYLFDDLIRLPFFGWLCSKDEFDCKSDKCKRVFSITLNLILNKMAFDRFEKLRDCDLSDLTIKTETFEMFKYMKSLEWVEKYVIENRRRDNGKC